MPEPIPACEAWHQHLAGWVVAQLSPADEADLLAHLQGCDACRAEADGLLAVAAVALGADPGGVPWRPAVDEEPPADLRRPHHRPGGGRAPPPPGPARVHRPRCGGGGAAGSGGGARPTANHRWRENGSSSRARHRACTPTRSSPRTRAARWWSSRPAGSTPAITYALWLTPPGGGYQDRVAAGTFRPDEDGEVDVRLRSALPAHEMGRIWATTPSGEIALDTKP